ncbi:class I SAM-dependent methyltransferase [Streptomyces sp. HNM0645]|uniref:SAM-dependent methyltransferase n=1 Tax=Streptomyces sp. HNM0645 TaxID=2782343 RepID=UPI0024B840FC|nr:class I SAM-dependent methyltransferase [Streptomyces sp. HNM0645]MDI9887042.1 class I SAM-dependent methyltransferase [Streptomyces sp. HNM0645]
MADDELPPRLTHLAFHGPLSEERADRLVARLSRREPATVLDIGCGWGELMLRLLEAAPGAKGVGIDLNGDDLARGRRNAAGRGLLERARFLEESATGTPHGPADVVLCVGSGQALLGPDGTGASGTLPATTAALRALRSLVTPGGRVLFGEGFWQRLPTSEELAAMWPGARADDHLLLAEVAEAAIAAGFRVEAIETAGESEWEDFESGYLADVEEWLARHPEHPLAGGTRERVDRHRASWLRGYRNVLGLAYLTLIPVA